MGKVFGAVFTIIGGLVTLFVTFLYFNSSAYLPYNPEAERYYFMETGYVLPGLGGLFLLIAGIVFLKVSDHR